MKKKIFVVLISGIICTVLPSVSTGLTSITNKATATFSINGISRSTESNETSTTLNHLPSAPSLKAPKKWTNTLNPILEINNATDEDGDSLTYTFEVYRDEELTNLVTSGKDILQDSGGTTSWAVNNTLSWNTKYWWRACANDGKQDGSWSEVWSFTPVPNIIVYPNPCYSNKGQVVTMANLPLNSKVYIYTISGELVKTLDDAMEITSEGGSATATWDLRNEAGNLVAQGVYIYFVPEATGNRKTGKIAIIK